MKCYGDRQLIELANWRQDVDVDECLDTLKAIAATYPKKSRERVALEQAAHGLLFSHCEKTREQFMEFLKSKDRPLSARDLVYLRFNGLDIPDHLLTPEISQLLRDVDSLVARLQNL